ncbi:MAG: zf-HC2 domain-containing protein, partial [Candidatus Dormibacteria bacterium]
MKCSLLSLSSYIDNELEAGRRGELEAHLVGCQRCTAGLEHLHEEVDRISGLAPVHVSDQSARALMEQLGLLEPGEMLPNRAAPPRALSPMAGGTLPWLNGEAGKALPWRADRRHIQREPVADTLVLPADGVDAAQPLANPPRRDAARAATLGSGPSTDTEPPADVSQPLGEASPGGASPADQSRTAASVGATSPSHESPRPALQPTADEPPGT